MHRLKINLKRKLAKRIVEIAEASRIQEKENKVEEVEKIQE